MTKDEALAKAATKWWETATHREIAEFQLNEPLLCCPFGVFHEAVEKTLGRPVWTHEFAHQDLLRVELAGNAPAPTMEMIVNQLPADRTIVVGVPEEHRNG